LTTKRETLVRRWKKPSAFFLASCFLVLAGCAGGGGAVFQSLQAVGGQVRAGIDADGLPQNPDPRFRYLRIEVPGLTPAMWVLAYLDEHPMGGIEVWYSATNQVIKLQNGRVVATRGLAVDWPTVRFLSMPPAWAEFTSGAYTPSAAWEREHDELPSYRFGVRERIVLQRAAQAPALVNGGAFTTDQARQYAWFQETATPQGGQSGAAVTNWYAWGLHSGQQQVVYSVQCLKPDFCLRIQRWPVQENAS
jgi:hypothetical protein